MATKLWLLCLAFLAAALIYCHGQNVPQAAYPHPGKDDPEHYNNNWEYPEQRPADYLSYRKLRLYDHGIKDQVQIDFSKAEHEQALEFHLPFFGFAFKYIKMNLHGFLHFGAQPKDYSFPVKFPIKPEDTVQEKDPSLIAVWLGPQSLVTGFSESGLYLRVVSLSYGQDDWLSQRIRDDFRGGMIGAAEFSPQFAIIATWRNITVTNAKFQGTNTYQVVLATDEKKTYAMFNYDVISWFAHDDVNTGKNGKQPFIGFNAGNTTRTYEFIPYSQQPRISKMAEIGFGNDIPGRLFFQINEEIWPGTCIEWDVDPELVKHRPRLTFFPRWANMLGGTMINVTGPCFREDLPIKCFFQDMSGESYPGIYRDQNHATCLMPPVFFHGYIDLTVAVGTGDAIFYGKFYIQNPDLAEEEVLIPSNRHFEELPDEFEIQWKSERLIAKNNTGVELHIWGYNDDDEYPRLTYIDKLATANNGDRRLRLNLNQFRDRYYCDRGNREQCYKLNYRFGFLSINVTDPNIIGKNFKHSPIIWSRPMPLSWYLSPQWARYHGNDWKDQFCNNWYLTEKYSDRFAITLWRCPCTLTQANFDIGRFTPDSLCSTYAKKCDPLHKGALHCVRTGRPSVGGSGQTCCYDIEGELMLTADQMYGGRPSRVFSYGILPYNQRVKVPTLSNWNYDNVPFFYCCHWQNEKDDSDSCQKFKYWRTSQDCSAYQPPGYAAIFGDPHFVTFDNVNYTFNGRGEFMLVQANDPKAKLMVQGRFEQAKRSMREDPVVNGTHLTAIAVKDNMSSTVEFYLRPRAARRFYMIYTIVDGEFVYFWDETLRIQYFKGVTLYQPTGIYNMSRIVAMFDSGAGVEVYVFKEQLLVNVFLPIEFLNITRGLLGFWDKNPDNDFMLPNTNNRDFIPRTSSSEVIYDRFGNKYRLNETASLFSHTLIGYDFSHYDAIDWRPIFGDPPRTPDNFTFSEEDIRQACSNSKACRYDFIATWNKDYARTTKEAESNVHQTYTDIRHEEIRCPALEKPANGRKSEIRNFVGRTVKFTCNDGYRLVGTEVRQCKEYGLWTWGVDAYCMSNSAYARKIAGITLGILLPIVLIIALAVWCFCRRTNRTRTHYTGSNGDKFQERRTYKPPPEKDEKISETVA